MKLNEFQAICRRTQPVLARKDALLNACMGLIGETGEIVDALKKWRFQSGDNYPLPREKLVEEIGDAMWYCAYAVELLGLTLEDVAAAGKNLRLDAVTSDGLCDLAVYTSCCMMRFRFTLDSALYAESPIDSGAYIGLSMALLGKICEILETSMDDVMEMNIAKLRRRYPDGFDPERSLHRKE